MQLHTVEQYSDNAWAVPYRTKSDTLLFLMPPVDTYAECLMLAEWFTKRTGLIQILEPARISHLIVQLGEKQDPLFVDNEQVEMSVAEFVIIQARKDNNQNVDHTSENTPAMRTFHFTN